MLQAVLFDCDGVLAETERDGHRVANNLAFQQLNIDAHWDAEEYRDLVRISGGKERLKYYFSKYPEKFQPSYLNDDFIATIYREKTRQFLALVSQGKLKLRPGIARILKELNEREIFVAVCSTSHEDNVRALLEQNLGSDYATYVNAFYCGDIVKKKKPAPDVYLHCLEVNQLDPNRTIVIEDSANGFQAATAAGLTCLVTQSYYTADENFDGSPLIVDTLGDETTPIAQLISADHSISNIHEITVDLLTAILPNNNF